MNRRTSTILAAVFVVLVTVAALATFTLTRVTAQEPQPPRRQGFPSVVTSHGFVVEEVRVGGSCVIVVSRANGDDVQAVPCR